MKGNTEIHLPNDKYRNNYEAVFGKQKYSCPSCGLKRRHATERICKHCEEARCINQR